MSTAASLRAIGRGLDDPAALDDLLDVRTGPPDVLALGEPVHGVAAFPALRNDVLRHLVERGFRSILLETDIFAASVVDAYAGGAPGDIDAVLATGFSHGFGTVPGNRELVEWLRAYNAGRPPGDRVRFHGFDAPLEIVAPSPRRALTEVAAHLPDALRPASAADLDALLGDDADWANEAAVYDPSASIGDSARARTLRLIADDLAGALHRASPTLRPADPDGYDHAVACARTAQGLLRYHAAMATPGPDRVGTLFSLREEMMAANLLAIVERERRRGPSLVFAHNEHLRLPHPGEPGWGSAGAIAALTLGERYLFVATDGAPHSDPDTLQGALAAATTRRTLFPAPAVRAALPPSVTAGAPMVRGHIPLTHATLTGTDAVIFVTDTDGEQHRYW